LSIQCEVNVSKCKFLFWKLKGRRCEIPDDDDDRVDVSQTQPHNVDWIQMTVYRSSCGLLRVLKNIGSLLNMYVVSNITLTVERV